MTKCIKKICDNDGSLEIFATNYESGILCPHHYILMLRRCINHKEKRLRAQSGKHKARYTNKITTGCSVCWRKKIDTMVIDKKNYCLFHARMVLLDEKKIS